MTGIVGVHNLLKDWKKGDMPMDPMVRLIMNRSLGEIEGFPALTANLAADSEVDFEVKRLKEDLDRAAIQAKRILKEQKAKILASLKDA